MAVELRKAPEEGQGILPIYSLLTAYRGATFDRWVWKRQGEYLYPPTEADADQRMDGGTLKREEMDLVEIAVLSSDDVVCELLTTNDDCRWDRGMCQR